MIEDVAVSKAYGDTMCNMKREAGSYLKQGRLAIAHRTVRLAIHTDTSFLPTRIRVIRIVAIIAIIQSGEGSVRFTPVERGEVERVRDADGFIRFG